MRKIIFLALIIFSSPSLDAQTVKKKVAVKPKSPVTIISAKSQRWSGGIVGSMGSRYYIDFTTAANTAVKPDTVWIGDKCFPLKIYRGEFPTGQDVNCKLVKGKLRWTYSFYINQNESTDNVPAGIEEKKEEVRPKAPVYNGDAAISYTYNHKKQLKVVPSFTRLEALNYP